jgi:hypothetical protein
MNDFYGIAHRFITKYRQFYYSLVTQLIVNPYRYLKTAYSLEFGFNQLKRMQNYQPYIL